MLAFVVASLSETQVYRFMILFVNVFLTDKPFDYIYDRGRLGWRDDKFDVFKYCLSSYSVLPWEHVIIYCELDELFKHREQELSDFIQYNLPNATFYNYRNTNQTMWKESLNKVFDLKSDGLVWYTCNDDHPFIDYNLDCFNAVHKKLLELDKKHPYTACQFTTWPVYMQNSNLKNRTIWQPETEIYEVQPELFVYRSSEFGSVQIVNQRLLRSWWFDHDYGDKWLPRTDSGGNNVIGPTDVMCVCPRREMCAHQDGFSFAHMDLNSFPPLEIPKGFFENDVKMMFGSAKRVEGYIHCNPLIPTRKIIDPVGVDYRWVEEDIPLFWKGHISKIEVAAEHDRWDLLAARNESILKAAGIFWQISREELIEACSYALRKDSNQSEFPLLKESESIERFTHPAIYKENTSKAPVISVIVIDEYGSTLVEQAIDSLQRQDLSREEYEIIWIQLCEVSLNKKINKKVLAKVDAHAVVCQYEEHAEETFHRHAGYNLGLTLAKGKIITCCDSFGIYPTNFLSSIASSFDSGRVSKIIKHECSTISTETYNPEVTTKLRSYFSALREDILKVSGADEAGSFAGELGDLSELIERLNKSGIFIESDAPKALITSIKAPYDDGREKFILQRNLQSVLPAVINREILFLQNGTHLDSLISRTKLSYDINVAVKDLNRAIWNNELETGLANFKRKIIRYGSGLFGRVNDAITAFLSGQNDQSLIILKELTNSIGGAEINNLYAFVLFAKNDIMTAKRVLEQSLEICWYNQNARLFLAEVLLAHQDMNRYAQHIVESALLYPKNIFFKEQLAKLNPS